MSNRPPFRRALPTVVFLIGLLAFRSVLADQYVIPSGSMEPTIQIGDHVLVDKRAFDLRVPLTSVSLARTGEVRRGDIVVFEDPREPGRHLIKRASGLPGDRVVVRGRELVVPPEHYYFLGDNRDNSSDSRDWGFVPRRLLRGRALRVLYSVSWDGWIPEPTLERAEIAL